MRTPVPEYLSELLDAVREKDGGAVADYIPELAKADPGLFGVALTTVDGRTYSAGDDEHEFSIQSISKPFAYAAALTDRGVEEIMSKISVEPSGEAFNELSLERGTNRPKNPMINAGAIAVHSLLMNPEASLEERAAHTVEFFSRLAGRELQMDEEVFRSEQETTDRNMALAHMLRNYGLFEEHAHNVVAGYVAQCAIRVTVRDLAIMGATLANGGVQPSTGERVCSPEVARQVLAVMVSAGMYDASGTWFADVGIPAKSGVAGGVLGVLPGQLGIGVLSPRLDAQGNSVRGVQVFRKLSDDMGLHLINVHAYGHDAVRSVRQVGRDLIIKLQGNIGFTGAESVLSQLEYVQPPEHGAVIFDLTRVTSLNDVGRRMLLEGMLRLKQDGARVGLIDTDGVLPDPDLGDGTYPERRGRIRAALRTAQTLRQPETTYPHSTR